MQILGYSIYSKDKDHAFRLDRIIQNAKAATFQVIDRNYSKDKDRLFYQGEEIKGANVKSFQRFSDRFHLGVDDKYVYFKNERLKNSDSKTFKIFNGWFWKDKNNVYFYSMGAYPHILPEVVKGYVELPEYWHWTNRMHTPDFLRWIKSQINNINLCE